MDRVGLSLRDLDRVVRDLLDAPADGVSDSAGDSEPDEVVFGVVAKLVMAKTALASRLDAPAALFQAYAQAETIWLGRLTKMLPAGMKNRRIIENSVLQLERTTLQVELKNSSAHEGQQTTPRDTALAETAR